MFVFSKLPREAQRAAFANMSKSGKAKAAATTGSKASGSKNLGSGARHKQLRKTQDTTPEFKRRYGRMTDAELQDAKLKARERARTDLNAMDDVHMIRREQDRRDALKQDVAKAPAPTAHQLSPPKPQRATLEHLAGPHRPKSGIDRSAELESIARDRAAAERISVMASRGGGNKFGSGAVHKRLRRKR